MFFHELIQKRPCNRHLILDMVIRIFRDQFIKSFHLVPSRLLLSDSIIEEVLSNKQYKALNFIRKSEIISGGVQSPEYWTVDMVTYSHKSKGGSI